MGTYFHKFGEFRLREVLPINPMPPPLSERVAGLSPSFAEIYGQSLAAEAHNLTQIVGIGLRKALEYLVKDYLVWLLPAEKETIKATLLGPCIQNYIEDANVKICAQRAVWLGNDETHYTRKWESKDIEDLKVLVRLTQNWVENSLLTKHYFEDMQPKK